MTPRVIDLSLLIDDNMPSHKFFQRPVHIPHIRHEESISLGLGTADDPMSMATSYIGTLDHIGTHVDAFFHVKPDGLKIAEMPHWRCSSERPFASISRTFPTSG